MNFHCYVVLYGSFCTLLVLKMLTYAEFAPLFLTSQRTEITAHYEFSLLCGIVPFFLRLARIENAHICRVCSAFSHLESYSRVANAIFYHKSADVILCHSVTPERHNFAHRSRSRI